MMGLTRGFCFIKSLKTKTEEEIFSTIFENGETKLIQGAVFSVPLPKHSPLLHGNFILAVRIRAQAQHKQFVFQADT